MLADGDEMFGSRGSSQEGQGQHFCWGVGGKCWMKTRTWEKIMRIWLGEDGEKSGQILSPREIQG